MIGRLWTAALQINDGRVSEAHALVSLRGRDLKLLALRGRFGLQGKPLSEVTLKVGQEFSLASGLALTVLEVSIPEGLLALEADGVARQVLTGVTSLFGGSRPRLAAGWKAGAEDHVWPTGEAWMRGPVDAPSLVVAGDSWRVDGMTFRAVAEQVEKADATVLESGYGDALKIVNRFDTVHLVRVGRPVVVISGRSARLISELATTGCALSWDDLARQLWGDGDRTVLRRRWDMQLMRLRKRLRDEGIRSDLVRPDGSGLVELVLGAGDVLIDES
jgi:hypothetical protein